MEYPAHIAATRHDTAGYTHLSLTRPAGYTYRPGQYVTLAYGGEDTPRFLALASHPSEEQLLFVSRHGADMVANVVLSAPQGKGFACNFASEGSFLFITHGSGIAAIRPAIRERAKARKSTDTLLYGIANAESMPDLDCLSDAEDIKQLRAYSRGSNSEHVQDVLKSLDLSPYTNVLLIGSKEMMESCRAILSEKNIQPNKIFSNY